MVPRETRSKPFKVNLTPSMHARLEVLAERLGMAPSTLATVAISEYVAQKNSALEIQKEVFERVAEKLIPEFRPLLEAMKEAFEKKRSNQC